MGVKTSGIGPGTQMARVERGSRTPAEEMSSVSARSFPQALSQLLEIVEDFARRHEDDDREIALDQRHGAVRKSAEENRSATT